MNLTKLFETQKILDQRIVEQHGLEGQDLLPEKIIALQVELAECANEWRGFKFWSKDHEPRTEVPCKNCDGSVVCHPFIGTENSEFEEVCEACQGSGTENPLLEEYVDCLHFILSIGIELENDNWAEIYYKPTIVGGGALEQFSDVYFRISDDTFTNKEFYHGYMDALSSFLGLGELLGFAWEQIEQAYYSKNEINHTRQDTGY